MTTLDELAAVIVDKSRGAERFVVAVAGAPGAGKSTLTQRLAALVPGSAILEGDGYHYDNLLLDRLRLRHRKGAPETFDCRGLELALRRLRAGEDAVVVPVFDRRMDVARAGAAMIGRDATTIIVEGNYLLVDREPWAAMRPLFDYTVFIEVPEDELARRLVRRWTDLGASEEAARARVEGNDLPNIEYVCRNSAACDFVWRPGTDPEGGESR